MPNRNITCCFSGHRIIKKQFLPLLEEKLFETLKSLYEKGYTRFAAGGALGFDTLAAKTVIKLREEFNDICLILVLPCKNQAEKWRDSDKQIYEEIKKQSDLIIYTTDRYIDGCMQARNRALVDMSSVLVCYKNRDMGGTAYTVNYAVKEGTNVINLADNNTQEIMDI